MHIQKMKEAGRVRMMIADVFWLSVFVSLWTTLILFWNTWWALLLVPAFGVMLSGLSETMHQGVHGNLCGRVRPLNDLLGKITGAVVGIDFTAYREFHLKHHRLVNTPDDPERPIYSMPAYAAHGVGWKDRSRLSRFGSFLSVLGMFAVAMFSGFNGSAWHVVFMRLAIPSVIGTIGYFEGLRYLIPVKILVTWLLPFMVLICVDFFLTQSEHYGTQDKPSAERINLDEQYQVSWNLKLPWPLSFMVFRRNLHAEHHGYPGMHWWFGRDQKIGRTLRLTQYLGMWWANGPRVMT